MNYTDEDKTNYRYEYLTLKIKDFTKLRYQFVNSNDDEKVQMILKYFDDMNRFALDESAHCLLVDDVHIYITECTEYLMLFGDDTLKYFDNNLKYMYNRIITYCMFSLANDKYMCSLM